MAERSGLFRTGGNDDFNCQLICHVLGRHVKRHPGCHNIAKRIQGFPTTDRTSATLRDCFAGIENQLRLAPDASVRENHIR